MKPARAAVWNARAALLYSLGAWTTLGGLIYYSRLEKASTGTGTENENDPEANQGVRKEVHTREYPFGLTVTTEITYKEVPPPLTQLLRRVVSFFVPNDGPPSEK
ncbi:small integral membrane protein 26 isoform X1 [Onychostruthus taczanowskii]|uniref:small integral membrane protein 26 isoform X1 n=1 Tax=Onychostruthus taczanowskii TaxID=356909 RepID=UPI001B801F35|nr:small integral membrane protein 26 isoform X1 [Onychostruthus taczanowskii]